MVDIYIFLGPPGSGKGTLSNLCISRLGWLQFSTGNVCREHIEKKTALGKEIDLILKSGKLISDNIIVEIVDQWLAHKISGANRTLTVVLDGFPRTLVQAVELNRIIYGGRFKDIMLKIVKLSVSDDIVIDRLSARMICKNNSCGAIYSTISHMTEKCTKCNSDLIKRADDTIDAIKNRLDIYYKHELEMLKYYEDINQKIEHIDVDTSVENVFNRLLALT